MMTPITKKTHPQQVLTKTMTEKKKRKIPSLPQIARKVARLEKTQLDEKQYIAYEMIACTFLLGLVNDGSDKNTKLDAAAMSSKQNCFFYD